jgi:hypothetical protein
VHSCTSSFVHQACDTLSLTLECMSVQFNWCFQECRPTMLGKVSIASVALAAVFVWTLEWRHLKFVRSEERAPWDLELSHFKWKFYTRCPKQPPPISTTCDLPKLFVLCGRPAAESAETRATWDWLEPEVWNFTTSLAKLHPSQGCQRATWKNQLHGAYREMFQDVLAKFPQNGFLFVEDDVSLVDRQRFQQEACRWARQGNTVGRNKALFYSFFKTSNDLSKSPYCFYNYGTQAFYATRKLMTAVVQAPTRTRCRMPIDVYIHSIGPWYATQFTIIRHGSLESTKRTLDPKNLTTANQNAQQKRVHVK